MKKHSVNYRLDPAAIEVLEKESERTRKTKTAVIEDALLFRRQFGDEADAAALFVVPVSTSASRPGLKTFCGTPARPIGSPR